MKTRLHRKLGATAALFEYSIDDGTLLDDSLIRSVSINRGKTEAGGGVAPSTCEVAISSFGSVRTSRDSTFRLTTYGAARLATLTGATASVIKPRFKGRIGRQSVADNGQHQQTTFTASSWTAQLPGTQRVYTTTAGANIGVVISTLLTPAELPQLAATRAADPAQYGTAWGSKTGKYSDLIGPYTSDLGILVRDSRAGISQIYTHKTRMDNAKANMTTAVPLTRSQGISPATWEQANDVQARNYRVSYIDSTNAVFSAVYGNPDDPNIEDVDTDMTHARFVDTSQPSMEGFALRARDWISSYNIPSITVDLLHLISSDRAYHRQQAAWLLSMEVGDPVYLSGDWYTQLRGIQFAESIKETITPDSWTLELGLVPSHAAVGEISPAIPSRVWDSATNSWNSETRKWTES